MSNEQRAKRFTLSWTGLPKNFSFISFVFKNDSNV